MGDACPHEDQRLNKSGDEHRDAGHKETHSNFLDGVSCRPHSERNQVIEVEEGHHSDPHHHADDEDFRRL